MRKRFFTFLILMAAAAVGCGGAVATSGDEDTGTDTPPPDAADVDAAPDPDAIQDIPAEDRIDIAPDPVPDNGEDTVPDLPPDTGPSACSDGIDNDGDGLVDMDDFDCDSPSDPVEGPNFGECTNDNHCNAGWEECDVETNTCYTPPHGLPCESCYSSINCGDGVMGEDPDRDWCVFSGITGYCTKDCHGDFDCPRGFVCDFGEDGPPLGYCVPLAGTCESMSLLGNTCGGPEDCGNAECHYNICTTHCVIEHDCIEWSHCVDGWCSF